MKRLFQISWLLILFTACSSDSTPDITTLRGFNIVIGEKCILNASNIDYYDHASHLLYLKWSDLLTSDLANDEFSVVVNGEIIFEGDVYCPNVDSVDIHKPLLQFGGYYGFSCCRFSYFIGFRDQYNKIYDPRNDKDFIQALKDEGLYHPGLTCELDTVYRTAPNHISVSLKLINNDTFNYYYFDPEKLDEEEFHYFNTGGLSIYSTDFFECYKNNVSRTPPDNIHCCLGEDRVSLIKSGETKLITIDYNNFDNFSSGDYIAVFPFAGEELGVNTESDFYNKGKMWLGNYHMVKKFTIE